MKVYSARFVLWAKKKINFQLKTNENTDFCVTSELSVRNTVCLTAWLKLLISRSRITRSGLNMRKYQEAKLQITACSHRLHPEVELCSYSLHVHIHTERGVVFRRRSWSWWSLCSSCRCPGVQTAGVSVRWATVTDICCLPAYPVVCM